MPSPSSAAITCHAADLHEDQHCRAVLDLVNMYAREPMARGGDLPPDVLKRLPAFLRDFPTTHVFLAKADASDEADLNAFVGIAVCVRSISSFTASPVMNVHDLAVRPEWRGRGVGRMLLSEVEHAARAAGCTKITLEVHRDNAGAILTYLACGFADGGKSPDAGSIWFFEKPL